MHEELSKKLIKAFPIFFNMSRKNTFGYYGFQISDGWYKLVYELAEKIDAQAKLENLSKKDWPTCSQIKEKFGTLRIYINCKSDAFQGIKQEYEAKSALICKQCGNLGKVYDNNCMRVLCKNCEVTYQERIK
jgi:hypothetical protein